MSNSEQPTLLDVLESCRLTKFSGLLEFRSFASSVSIWFVRGNLAHAETDKGECGWRALEKARAAVTLDVRKLPGELPPQRSIRVETSKLISAMKSSQKTAPLQTMHVPVPFHTRLQRRFVELQKRVSGLQTFETRRRKKPKGAHTGRRTDDSQESRILIEKSPLGSCWTLSLGNDQLIVKGDESVSTTELMWAGTELRKELDIEKGSAAAYE